MEELRRSIPRYGGAWRLGRHRVVANYAPHKSGWDGLLSNASLKKTFSIPQHRQECLCYLPEIFKIPGNFFPDDLVYTGKTTRGVGG